MAEAAIAEHGLHDPDSVSTGEQIGSLPQAFTPLAPIDSAVTLDPAVDRG